MSWDPDVYVLGIGSGFAMVGFGWLIFGSGSTGTAILAAMGTLIVAVTSGALHAKNDRESSK